MHFSKTMKTMSKAGWVFFFFFFNFSGMQNYFQDLGQQLSLYESPNI